MELKFFPVLKKERKKKKHAHKGKSQECCSSLYLVENTKKEKVKVGLLCEWGEEMRKILKHAIDW